MKQIYDKFDKTLFGQLPRALFPGRIEVIVSEREAERAVEFLMEQPLLGLDTETRPSFSSGRHNKVALLQVCCDDICFLFRLNHIGLPNCLIRLLEDKTIMKVGLSWHDDIRALSNRRRFLPGTYVELQEMAKLMGIRDMSLQKLYANVFGEVISKGQQLSNWEADNLSGAQQLYAATDAWACIRLYKELVQMKKEGYTLIHIPDSQAEEWGTAPS
ncbi:MAG: 3'-5' exonuclease domain-containing protein 2 [Bacteroidaceae bacterium]|nr:3'-5' exonuclease domain-containing protein 2 [Bacteroidaceae bacterium]